MYSYTFSRNQKLITIDCGSLAEVLTLAADHLVSGSAIPVEVDGPDGFRSDADDYQHPFRKLIEESEAARREDGRRTVSGVN